MMAIQLSNATVLAGGVSPPLSSVTAGYELHPDGSIWKSVNGTKTNIGSWDTVANQGASYECKFTLSSGTALTSNTAPSFTSMANIQSFALTKGVGSFTSVVAVQIEEIANHGNTVSATITLRDALSH
jgi:hypothetical protein